MEIYLCDLCHKIIEKPVCEIEISIIDGLNVEAYKLTLCESCKRKYISEIKTNIKKAKKMRKGIIKDLQKVIQ